MAESETSYIDYESFLDPTFSATNFANSLVLSTNNQSDTPLDLSTPLSRVLFDVQEIDTHIDSLTTQSALPLLQYTKEHAQSSQHILQEVEGQLAGLKESYNTLAREVTERYEVAEQVRVTAERLCQAVKMGRAVARSLMLGRQLEVQMSEFQGQGSLSANREDYRAMIRAAHTLLSLRQILQATQPGEEGEDLHKVDVIKSLREEIIDQTESKIISRSQQLVKEFSMSSLAAWTASSAQSGTSATTFAQTEDMKARATSALTALYLLSPTSKGTNTQNFKPTLLVGALEDFIQASLKSSLASLARALGTLPTLDRTLLEISARCQNIVALEALLSSTKPPQHPILETRSGTESADAAMPDFLQPLLQSLDTSSLPSYFWRSLASALSPRVQEIINRGGVSARTLRSNKEKVRDALRECVNRGSQLPVSSLGKGEPPLPGGWEREAAVMVGSVTGVLGR